MSNKEDKPFVALDGGKVVERFASVAACYVFADKHGYAVQNQMAGGEAKKAKPKQIKFNKFNVTNGVDTARVFYSLDNRGDKRKAVTIYAKDYDRKLGLILADVYKNDTDSMTDYFDQGRAVLFEDHPLYAAARARAESIRGVKSDA